jgi:hypothetical protein
MQEEELNFSFKDMEHHFLQKAILVILQNQISDLNTQNKKGNFAME